MSFFIGLVLVEGTIALLLMWGLRPVIKGLDFLTANRGPAVTKTAAAMIAVILASTISSIYKIEKRISRLGSPTSADHFMLRTYLLDAFLMGFSLFLALVISRLHCQLHQISSLKLNIEALKKQSKAMENEYLRLKTEQSLPVEKETLAQKEIVSLKDLVADLRTKMEKLQLESLEKDKQAKTAEARVIALQKQSEGFLLEYDRLLEDNQNLRSQLTSLDRRLSRSDSKKHA